MNVTPEDVALLDWTRRRMRLRAAWVAATTTVGAWAAAGLFAGGVAHPVSLVAAAGGALLGAGAFRAGRRAYAFDMERLLFDRLLRRRDPAWVLDPEGEWPLAGGEPLFTAEGPVGGRPCRLGAVRLADGGRLLVAAIGDRVVEVRRGPEPAPSLWRPVVAEGTLAGQAEDLASLLAAAGGPHPA